MSVPAYALSLVLLAATVLPAVAAARALRRALVPAWSGSPAVLAEAVAALTLLVIVAEAVGAVGLFRAGWIVAGSILAGAAVTLLVAPRLARRAAAGDAPPRAGDPHDLATLALCLGGAALVLGEWAVSARSSLLHGMTSTDTLWYHMPFAAGFVQDASITHLHFVELQPTTAFFPANSELLHAIGIALFRGHDVLSPLLNIGFLALVMLAAWCTGRPWGVAPIALLGGALAASQPGLWVNNAGQAGNDVVALALFLCAVALVVNSGNRDPAVVLAAAAAGLAAGTRLNALGPVLCLAILSVALAPKGRRLGRAGGWVAAAGVAGGFWYVRNLFATGNPVPWFGIHLGPISWAAPPRPLNQHLEFSVAHYLTDTSVWRSYFRPGLEWALGSGWWAMLLLAAGGAIGAVFARRDALQRGLGLVAIGSALFYLVTPSSAAGRDGAPTAFEITVRYAAPAIALGLILLPTWLAGREGRRRVAVLGALAGTLLLTLGIRTDLWHSRREALLLALAIAAGTAAVAWAARGGWRPSGRRAVALTAIAALVLAGGFLVQRHYVRESYAVGTYNTPVPFSFMRDLHHQRIGVFGSVVTYQLFGRDLSNRVTYVGRRGPHGAFTEIPSCRAWRDALNRGGYRYVVVAPVVSVVLPWGQSQNTPRELGWTSTDPAARRLASGSPQLGIFRIEGALSPAACGNA
jgi:hypothetical protein